MEENTVHPYPSLARLTVSTYLNRNVVDAALLAKVSKDESIWSPKKSCFVSIKTLEGDLRGCIGTLAPCQPNLGMEIIHNAVSAATEDPRFKPVTLKEMKSLLFSVDVLEKPEPVSDLSMLNPKKWGVIVSKDARRGVLLPDLPGIDSVERQVSIAAQKAGIFQLNEISIERFSVSRYGEFN